MRFVGSGRTGAAHADGVAARLRKAEADERSCEEVLGDYDQAHRELEERVERLEAELAEVRRQKLEAFARWWNCREDRDRARHVARRLRRRLARIRRRKGAAVADGAEPVGADTGADRDDAYRAGYRDGVAGDTSVRAADDRAVNDHADGDHAGDRAEGPADERAADERAVTGRPVGRPESDHPAGGPAPSGHPVGGPAGGHRPSGERGAIPSQRESGAEFGAVGDKDEPHEEHQAHDARRRFNGKGRRRR